MGQENSKPTIVSDAAWERVQQEKLKRIEEITRQRELLKVLQTARCVTFATDLANYCSACHDVPAIMMLFPSYRQHCQEARMKLFITSINTLSHFEEDQFAQSNMNQIKKI